jgi:hypothetical protein
MKVVKIVAAAATSLVVANTVANLVIRKVQNSTGAKDVVGDALRTVVTPAVVTYRKAATSAV